MNHNLRILHVGLPNYSLSKALSKIGEYEFIDWTDWMALPNNTKNLRIHTINRAHSFNPDITFLQLQHPEPYDAETLKQIPGFKVHWTWDFRPNIKWMVDLADLDSYGEEGVNITCFTNEVQPEQMRDLGFTSEFLQSGFDNETFVPLKMYNGKTPATDKCPEIVFMGNNYDFETYRFPLSQFRVDMVDHLRNKYKERFAVFGHGWGFRTEALVHREGREATMYRSCKIAIAVSHYELERYTSDRLLRLLGSGAFCLCKWYPGIEKDFLDGVHLRTWKTLEELDDLIKYYLVHEDLRCEIAARGSEHVHANYTWDVMVEKLIKFSEI